jgi:hypothetical protein
VLFAPHVIDRHRQPRDHALGLRGVEQLIEQAVEPGAQAHAHGRAFEGQITQAGEALRGVQRDADGLDDGVADRERRIDELRRCPLHPANVPGRAGLRVIPIG